MHYYKFNISKWYLSTSHLSLEEEAVYFRLINHYYDTEKPIPLETQSVSRRLRLGSNLGLVNSILQEFFTKTKDGWVQSVCDELIADYQGNAEKNQTNGKKGGRPKKNKDLGNNPTKTQSVSNENPNETLTNNYKLLTTNHNNIGFDLFWIAYGKKKGKPNALKEWLKLNLQGDEIAIQEIINKAKDQAIAIPDPKFRKDPERWLKGHHWEDEYLPSKSESSKPTDTKSGFAKVVLGMGEEDVFKITR